MHINNVINSRNGIKCICLFYTQCVCAGFEVVISNHDEKVSATAMSIMFYMIYAV